MIDHWPPINRETGYSNVLPPASAWFVLCWNKIWTCRLRDLLQWPYLQELLPKRGTHRQRCGECLDERESEIQRQKMQLRRSGIITWRPFLSEQVNERYFHLKVFKSEIFSPGRLQEWDIFTCGNDGKAGTREDVGIVALAWLVRLQPINDHWSTKWSLINQSRKPK